MKGDAYRRKHGNEVSKVLAPGEPPLLEHTPHGVRFAKGHRRVPGSGRPPGGRNKRTLALQELVSAINAYGAEHGVEWLQRASRRSPTKALLALSRFLEYEMPKMRAVEQSGPGGGPVVVEIVNLDSASTKRPAQEDAVQDAPDEE